MDEHEPRHICIYKETVCIDRGLVYVLNVMLKIGPYCHLD